jgi:hypothetical protein
MLDPARVTLKLHRVEVGLASAIAMGVAALATFLDEGRLATFEGYLWTMLALLPLGVGLIVGVPVVSRELEGRTAQVAWSLNGSRSRWLFRQSVPIFLVMIVAVALVALAATALVTRPNAHPEAQFVHIGSYGVPALARAFGAFGLGIFLGALMGRAMPALVFGSVLALLLLFVSTGARDTWLAGQRPLVPIGAESGFIQAGWAMTAPDGSQLALDEARALAPAGVDPDSWLEEQGYNWLALGMPLEVATRWMWYDTAIFVAIGCVTAAGAALLVDRRRPG